MPPNNGHEDHTERLISLVARMNDALRDFSEEQRSSSERLERVERAVERLDDDHQERHAAVVERLIILTGHVTEARGGIEKVREETNPRIRLVPKVEESADGFEITDKQVRLPKGWAWDLLKLAGTAGGGALLMRAIQWLATGH